MNQKIVCKTLSKKKKIVCKTCKYSLENTSSTRANNSISFNFYTTQIISMWTRSKTKDTHVNNIHAHKEIQQNEKHNN